MRMVKSHPSFMPRFRAAMDGWRIQSCKRFTDSSWALFNFRVNRVHVTDTGGAAGQSGPGERGRTSRGSGGSTLQESAAVGRRKKA